MAAYDEDGWPRHSRGRLASCWEYRKARGRPGEGHTKRRPGWEGSHVGTGPKSSKVALEQLLMPANVSQLPPFPGSLSTLLVNSKSRSVSGYLY